MDKALLDAFRATCFMVCLDEVEWAGIRIDQPLPASLHALVGDRAWGFITAWNPLATARPEAENLAAERELHAALKQLPDTIVRPAIGVGIDWHEPSLFVVGADTSELDSLARRHRQLAYVYGESGTPALLRVIE
ncbi:MAG: DUF3293 domain-containing protein [Rhodanobacter sp.]